MFTYQDPSCSLMLCYPTDFYPPYQAWAIDLLWSLKIIFFPLNNVYIHKSDSLEERKAISLVGLLLDLTTMEILKFKNELKVQNQKISSIHFDFPTLWGPHGYELLS